MSEKPAQDDLPLGDHERSTTQPDPRQPLVVIIGPTAVGKTELAIQLAQQLEGEIVSADSRLLYRGMDIGTAKPTHDQRQQVPHHLIDVANPDQIWSLTIFKKKAREAISEIQDRNHLPFLVGGTGQYVRAIVEDWQIPKVMPADSLMRSRRAPSSRSERRLKRTQLLPMLALGRRGL